MADIGTIFIPEEIEDDNYDPIPDGVYDTIVKKAEMKDYKSGSGQYLWLEICVLSGDYHDRLLFHNFNIFHASAKASEISRRMLKHLCVAMGITNLSDTNQLLNKPFRVKVGVTRSDEYGLQNKITRFLAYEPSATYVAAPNVAAPNVAAPNVAAPNPATVTPPGMGWPPQVRPGQADADLARIYSGTSPVAKPNADQYGNPVPF